MNRTSIIAQLMYMIIPIFCEFDNIVSFDHKGANKL